MIYSKKGMMTDRIVSPARVEDLLPSYTAERVSLYCVEALDLLEALEKESVDLLFLDPPFNLGKAYGESEGSRDSLADGEYFDYMKRVVTRASELLKEGGTLYLYHLPVWALRLGPVLEEYLEFRHWIAMSIKNGFAWRNKLYPAHYALLYFTKGEPNYFKRPKVQPAKCRHCGEYVKDYGGYKKYVEDGINLSDVWEDVSPVRHPANKHRDANELPPTIANRIAAMSACEGGVFVDPFAGSGGCLVRMYKAGMAVVGADREKSMVNLISERIEAELSDEGLRDE